MPTVVIAINQAYEFSLGIMVGNIVGKISSRKDRTMSDGGVKGASGTEPLQGRKRRVPS